MVDFNDLWQELNEKLLQFIRSKIANEQDAEDILHDVFIKIFLNIDRLESKEAVHSWIYTIARNTIKDFYKKKKPVSLEPEKLDLVHENDFQDNMNDEITSCLQEMLFELPDKYLEVYKMYEHDDLKHKEIADKLAISVSASKVRLKRAKAIFKDKLLSCCDFEVDKYGNIIDYYRKKDCQKCDKC